MPDDELLAMSSAGFDLDQFPGVHLAVDVAVMTVSDPDEKGRRQLQVLLWRRPEGFKEGVWTLPGRFIRPNERILEAAKKCLREKAGITGAPIRHMLMLDEPGRDPRGWTMSIGCVAPVPYHEALRAVKEGNGSRCLVNVTDDAIELPDGQVQLPFELRQVVDAAVGYLRDRYYRRPDPKNFLPETFTLAELKSVHDAVLGPNEYSRDSFRRTFDAFLEPTGERTSGTVGKPAEYFKRARRARRTPLRTATPSKPRIAGD